MNDIKFSELPPGTYFIARQNDESAYWCLFLLISNSYNKELNCFEYAAVDQNGFLEIDEYSIGLPWDNLDRKFVRLL